MTQPGVVKRFDWIYYNHSNLEQPSDLMRHFHSLAIFRSFLLLFILICTLPHTPAEAATPVLTDGYTYVWTDFRQLNGGPVQNLHMTISNGTVNDQGHLVLHGGYADIDFKGSIYAPSLAESKAFSIAITYAAGSVKDLSTLFSTSFYGNATSDPSWYNGLFGAQYDPAAGIADIGYGSPKQTGSLMPDTLTGILASSDLTVMFEQNMQGELTIGFYAGRTLIASASSPSYITENITLGNLYIGGKGNADASNTTSGFQEGSDMTILGMGLRTYGTFDEEARQNYFDELGIRDIIPEPGSAALAIFGLAGLALRRRRSS